jgi:hypothetical protein
LSSYTLLHPSLVCPTLSTSFGGNPLVLSVVLPLALPPHQMAPQAFNSRALSNDGQPAELQQTRKWSRVVHGRMGHMSNSHCSQVFQQPGPVEHGSASHASTAPGKQSFSLAGGECVHLLAANPPLFTPASVMHKRAGSAVTNEPKRQREGAQYKRFWNARSGDAPPIPMLPSQPTSLSVRRQVSIPNPSRVSGSRQIPLLISSDDDDNQGEGAETGSRQLPYMVASDDDGGHGEDLENSSLMLTQLASPEQASPESVEPTPHQQLSREVESAAQPAYPGRADLESAEPTSYQQPSGEVESATQPASSETTDAEPAEPPSPRAAPPVLSGNVDAERAEPSPASRH